MKLKIAMIALFCAVIAPHAVQAQGSSVNENTCFISPSGGNSSGDITVAGAASQFGQTVRLSSVSLTFPTTLANDPVIDAYNSGAFGLVIGENPIATELTVEVNAANTAEGSQLLSTLQTVIVDIRDDDSIPGSGDEYLAPRDATAPLPLSIWSPIDLDIEFTQTVFIVMSGGITIDCVPTSTPIPFETFAVTTSPCDDATTCSGNGTCDFWGNCDCDSGFGGAGCECSDEFTCNNFGTCNAAGNCVCDPGFGGPECLCQDAIDCSGNGFCTPSGTCGCDPGFGGPDCSCDPAIDCNGNGACDASGACDCTDPAWEGDACDEPTCIPARDCNSNGTCDAGECVCDAGYTADDCGTEICVPGVNCTSVPVAVGDLFVRIVDTGTENTLEGSTIAWRSQDFDVFGQWPVNLGAAAGVNPMTVPPSGGTTVTSDPPTDPASGTFGALYASAVAGVLDFHTAGDAVCPNVALACGPQPGQSWNAPWEATFVTTTTALLGTLVDDVGPGTLPTTIDGAPVTYALDGALVCATIVGATECTGTGYLNAFMAANTPVGTEVDVTFNQTFVDPADPSGQTIVPLNVTVTFDEVPDEGQAEHTTMVASSQAAGSISSDFELQSLGTSVVFLDITTTAEFVDDVTVCLEYPETFANECDLRLLHNDHALPNEFQDATLGEAHEDCPFPDGETTCTNDLCINTVAKQICGGATSLSPWVLAEYVGNEAPVADAGPDQAITLVGTLVHLDGSDSYDLDGDDITYAWELSTPEDSDASLDDQSSATPSFVPDLHGNYAATLVVTDSNGLPSAPDSALVSFDNLRPVADAGDHQTVRVDDAVLLDGSGSSDPNGDVLTYEWSLVSQPVGSMAALANPTSETPSFTPDVSGTYGVQLTVNDGLLDSEIASVSVVATTAEGDLVDALEQAIDAVNGLDPTLFKNKSLQKNMAKHIGQAAAHVDNGKFNAARDKLEAVLRKTDGCADGGAPDPNDWIEDCAAQSQVHPGIAEALALIDEILGS